MIFVPIAFMTGYAQRVFESFGWTMTCAILVSLLVSFTLTPMLGARFLRRDAGDVKLSKQTAFFTWIERRYERMLNWSLNHPWVIVGISVLVFASTFPLNRLVGRDFIPNDDQGEFTIHVDLPEGLSLTGLTKFVDEIEPRLKLPELDHLLTQSSDRLNHVHFVPNLVELDKRKISTQEAPPPREKSSSRSRRRGRRSHSRRPWAAANRWASDSGATARPRTRQTRRTGAQGGR